MTIYSRLFFVLAMLIAAVGYTHFFHLTEMVSLRGFSVLEYMAHHAQPENFVRDFPGGSYFTALSIITMLYPPLQAITGLSGITLLTVMIWIEIACVLGGAWYLWRTLYELNALSENRIASEWGFVWLAVFLVLSHVAGPDLANFAFPFFHGQFYGFADGARLMAIAFAFKRRWALVAFWLVLGFMIHPIKTLVAGCFIAGALVADPKQSLTYRSIFYALLTAVFCALWGYFWIGVGRDTGATPIADDVFIGYTRLLQYHWYPLDSGLVSTSYFSGLSPFIASIGLAVLSLLQFNMTSRVKMQWLAGFGVLLIVTALGVFFSAQMQSQELIKLCLIRASDLLTLLAPILVIMGLVHFWQKQEWVVVALYLAFLFGAFETTKYMDLGLVILAWGYLYRQTRRVQYLVGAIILLGVYVGMWALFPDVFNPVKATLKRLPVVLMIYGVMIYLPKIKRFNPHHARIVIVCVAMMVMASMWTIGRFKLDDAYLAKGRDFHEVQLWAKDNTAPTALFMVDPCINYGWRDFSQRSSVGTPREWFMTGWIYITDGRVLAKGQAMADTLGLDMKPFLVTKKQRTKNRNGDICAAAQQLYYQSDRKPLQRFADKFQVDYFVMQKDQLAKQPTLEKLTPVFANTTYRLIPAKEIKK